MARVRACLVLSSLILLATVAPVTAQGVGAGTGGAIRRAQEARLAGTARRVLLIGAHPDDEDTELLTILTRGQGVETAYLSLTRGDGGQNLIGTELGQALGVLRTEELLAARALDGGRQYFSRAYDFGFSKSPAEAFRFWPRDSLVKDAVRIIRRFRPQVVISMWAGTAIDGHGHHQAAGMVAREAFDAAGDASRFPELQREEGLSAWQPSKFYRSGRQERETPALVLDGGVLDPAEGQSLHQIAMRSRSLHRSQDQGRLEDPGPSSARVILVATAAGVRASVSDSLFAGVVVAPSTGEDSHSAGVRLADAGIILDLVADDDEVVRGQEVTVTATVWNGGPTPIQATILPLQRRGWTMPSGTCTTTLGVIAPGAMVQCRYTAAVSDDAEPTTPYFLRVGMNGASYRWDMTDPTLIGEPFESAPVAAAFTLRLASGDSIRTIREATARTLDQAVGEVRHPVQVVPRIAVDLSPDKLLWPIGVRARPFRVTLEHLAKDSSAAEVSLLLPPGWSTSAPKRVVLRHEGERAEAVFTVTAPARALSGEYAIAARVVTRGDTSDVGLTRVRYPHIRSRNIVTHARAVLVLDAVTFPRTRAIAYVRGAADQVPEALRNTGLPVRVITGDAIEGSVLDSFRVVVIGPRAYEVDPALQRAHPKLMRWLERGGTLIMQYQQYPFLRGGFAPLPFTISSPHDRVAEEDAPVTVLVPMSPVFRTPNRIRAADFDGWTQERGLYFARSWDSAWTPLLEMHDSDDARREGSLLIGRRGRGTVVYTGLAFFRQLPAAVPGAWRLFMNLLALGDPLPARRP